MKRDITADELRYLVQLVDQDTTGNKDNLLYLVLMELWDECDDDTVVTISVPSEE